MSGHTKGPWLYRGKSDSVHMPDAEYPYGSIIFQFHDEFAPSDYDLALILAAPDILHALQNIENDNGQIPDHAWKVIQDAIAKATIIQ